MSEASHANDFPAAGSSLACGIEDLDAKVRERTIVLRALLEASGSVKRERQPILIAEADRVAQEVAAMVNGFAEELGCNHRGGTNVRPFDRT